MIKRTKEKDDKLLFSIFRPLAFYGKGFTLIELSLVIAIIAMVSVLSIPFIQIFQTSSDLYTYTDTTAKTLRRARHQAVSGKSGSDWGVYFNNVEKKIIFFKGNNYSSRDTSYDQNEKYPDVFDITTDFGDEIYFSINSGLPSSYGTVFIYSSASSESKNIQITNLGLISK